MLPDKPHDNSLVVQDLYGEHLTTELVGRIVELHIVGAHARETEMLFPV